MKAAIACVGLPSEIGTQLHLREGGREEGSFVKLAM